MSGGMGGMSGAPVACQAAWAAWARHVRWHGRYVRRHGRYVRAPVAWAVCPAAGWEWGSTTDSGSFPINPIPSLLLQTSVAPRPLPLRVPNTRSRSGVISLEPVTLDQSAVYQPISTNCVESTKATIRPIRLATLNLVRIPRFYFAGKRHRNRSRGRSVTMTISPHLSDELLPTTFRNLIIINDLVEQLAYPVTQFITNPDNSIYLDDRKSSWGDLTSDVADLFKTWQTMLIIC